MNRLAPVPKSLYVFLCSVLGALLFLVLHGILVLLYGIALEHGYTALEFGMSAIMIQAVEYVTMAFAVIGGAWYGIWVGLSWYELVYEQSEYVNLFRHWYGTDRRREEAIDSSSRAKVEQLAQKIEREVRELESMAGARPAAAKTVKPIRRKLVRKKAE